MVESAERQSPPFVDPTESGWKKLTKAWFKETLERTSTRDSVDMEADVLPEVIDSFDSEYSLADDFKTFFFFFIHTVFTIRCNIL